MSAATVSPCPIRGRVQSATAAHVRVQSVTASASTSFPWAVHDRDRAANVRVLAVGRPCPDTWLAGKCPRYDLAISRMMSCQRLRHFPRESLIASLTPGEASIVKVEVAGHSGETTLTTRSEPYNRRATHAEPKAYLARMRDVESR